MRKLTCVVLGLLFLQTQLLAQNRRVAGTVVDSAGQYLLGVNIKVVGSNTGTSTDAQGNFSIQVPSTNSQLEISAVGFRTQVLPASLNGNMTIVLRAQGTQLESIVVTGIASSKRSQFAGAVTKVERAALADRPVGSFDQLLQGRIPGVLALTPSGQPGNASTIIIRGQSSIQGGTAPLYIVDGIPVEAGVFQSFNPNDFESIDVLRDASATALYGSRGSAGVIVVTTRRGKSGKMQLSYSGQMGMKSRPNFTFDPMGTPQLLQTQAEYGRFLNVANDASTQINLPGWYYSKTNPAYANLTPAQQARYNVIYDSIASIDTDWRDIFYRTGTFSNHQIALSGGTGRTRIYSSLAYYNEEGTTLRTNMQRVTLRNNVDYSDDKFSLAISSNVGYTKRNFQQTTDNFSTNNPFLAASIGTPYSRAYNNDGTIVTGNGSKYAPANALDLVTLDKSYNNQIKTTLGLAAGYKITNEITAGITAGIDFRETQSTAYGNRQAFLRRTNAAPTISSGSQTEGVNRFFQADVRPSVGFKKLINGRHDVDVNLYGEYIRQFSKEFTSTGYGIDPRTPNTPAAVQPGNAANLLFINFTGEKSSDAILSGLATARYTFDGKYTLTGSYRRDGSSKLPEKTRWQGFYSIGAVWDATRESFLSQSKSLSLLRLKLSYGGAGNHDNFPGGSYPYQATYGAGAYQGLVTQLATYPGNPELQWETTYILNFGIDFGFLRNRIYGDVNLYDKRTKDLFVERTLSAISGFGSLDVNAGELQNKGIEVSLNVEPVRTSSLVWTLYGNFALNRNKVLDLGGEPSFEAGTELISVGKPLGSHYITKWGGVDAATGAPLYYTADGKLTTDYNAAPAVQDFGTYEAPWKGGFGTNVRYKNFELSALFSWQKGAVKYDNLEYFTENPNGFLAFGYNQATTLRFWQKPGDVVTTPSPLYSTNSSSKLLHKADFIRFRDLSVAYNLPESVLSRTRFISAARFYIQGNNLHIWTNWRGMDPEAGSINLNIAEFPNPRAVTAGLDITF